MTKNQRIVAAVVILSSLVFAAKPFHMDEPFFLAIARHIVEEPLNPLGFPFNWYGAAVPMAKINNTPPLTGYLLAVAWTLSQGREWMLRLLFLPFDLAAALALYGIASRRLRSPLNPVLLALVSPAYFINMGHIMPEKMMAGFAFPCLWALLKGLDEKKPGWYWGSAVLFALTLLSKYAAVFLALPALALIVSARVSARRTIGYFCLAAAPLALHLGRDLFTGHGAAIQAVAMATSEAGQGAWSAPSHKLRSLLSFMGGGSVVGVFWPYLAFRFKPCLGGTLVLLGTFALFLPFFDLAGVRWIDRLEGIVFSGGAAWFLWGLFGVPGEMRNRSLWAAWIAGVSLVLLFVYWSVVARIVLFMVPPLVFALAEALEARWDDARLLRLYRLSLVVVGLLTLALSLVDFRYASAQKEVAALVSARYADRRLWCASHWGLQYYMEKVAGRELDRARGGWGEVRRDDVVVLSKVNANVLRPIRPILARAQTITVDCAIPLRLMSAGESDAGFYTNMMGFLPYSLSREPLDEFSIVEAL